VVITASGDGEVATQMNKALEESLYCGNFFGGTTDRISVKATTTTTDDDDDEDKENKNVNNHNVETSSC